MKKIIALIIILITIGMVTFFYLNNINNEEKTKKEEKPVVEKKEEKEKKNPIEEVYIDDNEMQIGIYRKSTRNLVEEYSASWKPEEIIGVFSVFATRENAIRNNDFDVVWKDYWNRYSDNQNHRIGYNMKFTLNTGEIIDEQILNPREAEKMYSELMFFVYDDVNIIPGRVYSHVTKEEMNDNTLLTTVKIVGDIYTKNIISPLELTAFTYNGLDDFDPATGKYRGNSTYSIIINKN